MLTQLMCKTKSLDIFNQQLVSDAAVTIKLFSFYYLRTQVFADCPSTSFGEMFLFIFRCFFRMFVHTIVLHISDTIWRVFLEQIVLLHLVASSSLFACYSFIYQNKHFYDILNRFCLNVSVATTALFNSKLIGKCLFSLSFIPSSSVFFGKFL